MSAQESPATPPSVTPRPTASNISVPRPERPEGHLTLAGVSRDGKQLLLVDAGGSKFTVDVDDRLRAALRGDPSRIGQLEIQMESVLRPRDIQARIRAGETPESVASAAQTSVEKVMPYATPVLAEREHVAERAQRSSIRRSAGDHPGARTLGEAVAARLRSLNVDPAVVAWDAWRREDGRWSLTGGFETAEHSGTGEFTFDQPGNYVVIDNDDARWLVGEGVETTVIADAGGSPVRRLSSVPQEPLPLGEDALELISEADQPMEAFLEEEAADAAALDPDPEQAERDHDPAAHEPAARRPVRKSRGRASVPSWDEIMFGGGKQE